MSTKYFFLLFGTLLLAQCVVSNTSEETSKDESKHSSEEKIDEDHLKRHVTKWYIKLLDQVFAVTKKSFDPVINDVQTNKDTTNTELKEKLTELEKVLEKAHTKSTTTNLEDEKREKNQLMMEIRQISWYFSQIVHQTTTPTEQYENVRKALETANKDLTGNIETFTDQSVQEIEKLWKGLSTTEQKEKQNLHDALVEIKNEPITPKKFGILDKLFTLTGETLTNAS